MVEAARTEPGSRKRKRPIPTPPSPTSPPADTRSGMSRRVLEASPDAPFSRRRFQGRAHRTGSNAESESPGHEGSRKRVVQDRNQDPTRASPVDWRRSSSYRPLSFRSTVLPTSGSVPSTSSCRSPDHATSYTRSCPLPASSTHPLMTCTRSRLAPEGSFIAAISRRGAPAARFLPKLSAHGHAARPSLRIGNRGHAVPLHDSERPSRLSPSA